MSNSFTELLDKIRSNGKTEDPLPMREVADFCDVPRPFLYKLGKGEIAPRKATVERLINGLARLAAKRGKKVSLKTITKVVNEARDTAELMR